MTKSTFNNEKHIENIIKAYSANQKNFKIHQENENLAFEFSSTKDFAQFIAYLCSNSISDFSFMESFISENNTIFVCFD